MFHVKHDPGKTLIIGASSSALEAAGLLRSLGHQVSVMVRTRALKGHDVEMSELIVGHLEGMGVEFIIHSATTEPTDLPQLRVHYNDKTTQKGFFKDFNTVLTSDGQIATVNGIGLDELGMTRDSQTGKVVVDENQRTSVGGIYALGGITNNPAPFLSNTEHSAELLCDRLFGSSNVVCNYDHVPRAVFTPLEYGFVGATEESALESLGPEGVTIYQNRFKPIHFNLMDLNGIEEFCYVKVICDKHDDERIIGLHILGHKAAEMILGYAVAMSLGATKSQLDDSISLHPTAAENLSRTIRRISHKCCKSGFSTMKNDDRC
ncbi:unnamed protein product [Notodromas monacha]|uniref:Glutathione-disulfide reductase n=1 Tax=Notodromas monacha TaxID=399045 RepID=A0A7R9BLB0_9CRUS|nr:unnamed protein product [Notodromas monacha]CAG0916100.1 unnamed protein product [Notodromas monacha]